jgi:hypothetical protein
MATMADVGCDPAAAEDFLSIVLSDDELVRAEFDAIMAEQWPDQPPDQGDRSDREQRPTQPAHRFGGWARSPSSDRRRNDRMNRWRRQRSPPPGVSPLAGAHN